MRDHVLHRFRDRSCKYAKGQNELTPLLQVQHAEVGIRIVSIFQKKWYLSSVSIDRPVMQVFVDKNGISNIPQPKSSGDSNTRTSTNTDERRHPARARRDACPDQSDATAFNRNPNRPIPYEP